MRRVRKGSDDAWGLLIIAAVSLVVLLLFGGFFRGIFVKTVDKGEVGVTAWFGRIEDQTLEPGIHLVNPLRTVHRVNVQTVKNEEPCDVPTKGGLTVHLKAVMLYHVDPTSVPKLLREVKDGAFEETIVDPTFKNAVRDACATYDPEALYTDKRQEVEAKIRMRLAEELTSRGFLVEQVMIQEPVMPQSVTDRIQAKIGAQQDVERMQYVLKQKQLEADAKVVEASGIAKSQAIIKKDLDGPYLQYQFIEALKVMALNHNMVYFVPIGPDGLPVVKPLGPVAGPGKPES